MARERRRALRYRINTGRVKVGATSGASRVEAQPTRSARAVHSDGDEEGRDRSGVGPPRDGLYGYWRPICNQMSIQSESHRVSFSTRFRLFFEQFLIKYHGLSLTSDPFLYLTSIPPSWTLSIIPNIVLFAEPSLQTRMWLKYTGVTDRVLGRRRGMGPDMRPAVS